MIMEDTQQDAATKRLERAKELVRKMLDRTEANGFTEAEAMEAASKVGALLQQFDIELTDITARDVSDMTQVDVYAADYSMAAVIVGVANLCSLKTYSMSGGTVATYRMFGHKPDVELATFLYEVCAEACDHGWQQHMDKHGYSKAKRDSFRIGFGGRVANRMSALRKQRDEEAKARAEMSSSTALLIIKDQIVEAEFGKLGIKLVQRSGPSIRDNGAYYAGQAHGNTVNLNNPLEDGRGVAGAIR